MMRAWVKACTEGTGSVSLGYGGRRGQALRATCRAGKGQPRRSVVARLWGAGQGPRHCGYVVVGLVGLSRSNAARRQEVRHPRRQQVRHPRKLSRFPRTSCCCCCGCPRAALLYPPPQRQQATAVHPPTQRQQAPCYCTHTHTRSGSRSPCCRGPRGLRPPSAASGPLATGTSGSADNSDDVAAAAADDDELPAAQALACSGRAPSAHSPAVPSRCC